MNGLSQENRAPESFRDRRLPPLGARVLARSIDSAALDILSLGGILHEALAEPPARIREKLRNRETFDLEDIEEVRGALELAVVARPTAGELLAELDRLLPRLGSLTIAPPGDEEMGETLTNLGNEFEALAEKVTTFRDALLR